MKDDEPLSELAESPHAGDDACDLIVEGEHVRCIRYCCPRCKQRAAIWISEALEKAAFRCKKCGYVIVA